MLVGWAAVTDSLAWTPIILFAAIFCWTPPHFWALAIRYVDDYRAADVPMLPAVVPISTAARRMVGYTVAMIAATLVLVPVAGLGWIYTVAAVVLGAAFLVATVHLVRDPTPAAQHAGLHVEHQLHHAPVRRAHRRRPRARRVNTSADAFPTPARSASNVPAAAARPHRSTAVSTEHCVPGHAGRRCAARCLALDRSH